MVESSATSFLTVRELVGLPKLNVRLLEGRSGLDRPIRRARTIERADPGPYLRGEELVLTTGAAITDEAGWASFVRALLQANASAIGFSPANPHAPAPAALRESCRVHDVPLLEIMSDSASAAIIQLLADRLASLRDQEIGRRNKRERRLLAVLDEGRGLDGIVQNLAGEFGCLFVITDTDGTIRATGGRAPSGEAIVQCIETAELPVNVSTGVAHGTADGVTGQFALVSHRHQPTGWIGWIGINSTPSTARLGILQKVAPIVGLEMGARLELESRRRQEIGRLLEFVAAGAADSVVLKDQLALANLDGALMASAWRPDAGDRLREWREKKIHGETLFGHIVLTRPAAQVGGFAEENALAVGVGSAVELAGLATSLREAKAALTLSGDARLVSTWRELASIDSLLEQQPPERMLSFARQLILPLLPKADNPSDVMVGTLRTFLEEEGRVDSAAACLQIHPNSVRNRLHKVHKITGRNPFKFHDRTALYVGLWAWDRYLGSGDSLEAEAPELPRAQHGA
jgi:purine catabolism regulator